MQKCHLGLGIIILHSVINIILEAFNKKNDALAIMTLHAVLRNDLLYGTVHLRPTYKLTFDTYLKARIFTKIFRQCYYSLIELIYTI